MHWELKDSRIPTTADNIKENVDTLYDGRNTAGKQPEPLQPSPGQSEDQVQDTTSRSSPEQEMSEEYTDASDQGSNRKPPRELLGHDLHNSGVQTAYKPTGSTSLDNLNQTLT